MPVKIVTDSTASIPSELAAERGIAVVPLVVRFGTREYFEGVDLTPAEFYNLLETSPEQPATSQPNPAAFEEVYRRLGADGDPIVSIHISEQLSGTLASARQASATLPELSIQVMDSRLASIALGLIALEAARQAEGGADAESIVRLVEDLSGRSYVTFVVPTLEYLRRGGRIGGAQAFLGSLLRVKPVLEIRHGQVQPLTRVRSFSKAYAAMADYVRANAPRGLESAGVLHAEAEEHRQRLVDDLLAEFPPSHDSLPDIPIGPVIGTYTGRGAFGFAFVANP